MNRNLRLLVVDDERNMRESLKTVLESRGTLVDTVESAEQGLTAIEASDYFMVITDARLEGMSGYDFLREAHERWPELPVLMITAYATPKLAVEAIQTGAIDYLSKPFEPEELLHSVNRCAERHQLIQQNEKLKSHLPYGYQLDDIIGNCQKPEGLARDGPDGWADRGDHPDSRRERHRQGVNRGIHPPLQPTPRRDLRAAELRSNSRDTARE